MRAGLLAVGTVVDLELRQRVRSTAWYVLLGVAAALLLLVSLLLLGVAAVVGREGGPQVFSVIVFFVLLLGSLVTPALSGAAVNGDRDAGTLATTQVTLVSTAQLLIGKFLAAWTASLAFLAVAVPFLLLAVLAGGVSPAVVVVALLVTVLELGVVAAVGVGLSAVMARTVFSVVTVYLVVAALSLGTLIAFGLGGVALQTRVAVTEIDPSDAGGTCDPPQHRSEVEPRFDRVWVLLAANPYVVLADAVPGQWSAQGDPLDAFSAVKTGVRAAQLVQPERRTDDFCHGYGNGVPFPGSTARTPEQLVDRTVPGWFAGLAVQLLLGAASLLLGGLAMRTPARRVARGSRIA